ncbi:MULTISPECIES: L,D-transpeptidase family protein [Streptomyces]|uniref:L,D-transpeptidase family protein n=1 Tax=Streptomyces doudnae TaxID=3075536 RepID=A0ABD5F0K8_9ACTN|nr:MULTISPECIES: L,D-transpeptidase family protein [unclassified Streptomyces]MDT0440428.1 L,D-transpeptidase family protein [Streptomyces sp. DSM 41981]MYQ67380.1 L,D-transpeptidase family protein [Streptomyces sp. SID4950]SCE34096.1 L,D-peptidoglycan transpeptidase YkuD, ErfK/YbiS/YcfS/YnhG family [Streptomyces sp. SolWspMP-5a-2]
MITRRTRAVLLAASLVALTGCGAGTAKDDPAAATAPTGSSATPAPRTSVQAAPLRIPGLGPRTRAGIPKDSGQAVVVTGEGRDASVSRAVLYERTARGWRPGTVWPAHNALKGWTDHHMGGDLRSPIGVFGLTDAGGLLPDPGTRLPYDQGRGFTSPGTGFEGEPLDGSFDYVVAINYNRRSGTTPLDWTRPLGADRGGGIWFHVDHGGPTHGCVSLSEAHMKDLLRALDPARHPVVVMGDAASLDH